MPVTRARLRISDYRENRKNRIKHDERRIRSVSLSLTSMVDMFAILVIFLLSSTSTVSQWVEVGHGIDLPHAKFAEPPPRAATLQVSRKGIFSEEKQIASIDRPDGIRGWLSKVPNPKGKSYVNLVADKQLTFGVIKKVIAICQELGFKNVNLVVQPKN